MTPYELGDYELGNVVYAYEAQEEALADVRMMIEVHGTDTVRTWVLQYDDRKSPAVNIAMSEELIVLALTYPSGSAAD